MAQPQNRRICGSFLTGDDSRRPDSLGAASGALGAIGDAAAIPGLGTAASAVGSVLSIIGGSLLATTVRIANGRAQQASGSSAEQPAAVPTEGNCGSHRIHAGNVHLQICAVKTMQ
jgi:alkylated DNA nucleotide flippase Atl1